MSVPPLRMSDAQRLASLRELFGQGRLAETRLACERWLAEETAPAEVGGLLAQVFMGEGAWTQAASWFARTIAGGGEAAIVGRLGLALALRELGDAAGAEASLRALLAEAPEHFVARLRLGELLEARGERREALTSYFGALSRAQQQGRWRDDATTAPSIRPLVRHAMDAVDAGRRELFLGLLEPLRLRHGRDALTRIEQGLLIYLGELPAHYADPRQQPVFFYVPGLPAHPYPERRLFPWLEEWEAATDAIREEMRATRAQAGAYAPFLGAEAEALPPGLLAGSRGRPAWDAYFFYRHGQRYQEHARQCPATIAALERTPLVRIREHAPEICFSVLEPGTHILPHRGVTNTRLTAHLPLEVPEDCALVVGGIGDFNRAAAQP